MAEQFDGPVTINGELNIESQGSRPGRIKTDNIFSFGAQFGGAQIDNLQARSIGPDSGHADASLVIIGRNASERARLRVTGVVIAEDGIDATKTSVTELHVSGQIVARDISVTGDIRLEQADCAEDFTFASGVVAEPGSVMVLAQDGTLVPCDQAYDKRVVGIVSGAGPYRPGVVLDRQSRELQSPARDRHPIALLGKVFCCVDARYGAISVGDLLTTSATPGHAMKATDQGRAFGSTVGKALLPLKLGCGHIPVLVALQ